jgi:hypothetical protein
MGHPRRQSLHGKIERDQPLIHGQLSMCGFAKIFVSANCLRQSLFESCRDQKPWLQPQNGMLSIACNNPYI